MKKQLIFTTLALSFVLGAAQFTVAQEQTIDDFTTGNLQPGSVKSGSQEKIQAGSMLGGSRVVTMVVCDPKTKGDCIARNPYNQPSSFGFLPPKGGQPAAMVQTGGYFAPPVSTCGMDCKPHSRHVVTPP